MAIREENGLEERETAVQWFASQLWRERVLVSAAAFVGFVMWAGGFDIGWVLFAVLLLVLAGLIRPLLRADADTRPVTAAVAPLIRESSAEHDPTAGMAALLDALDMPALIVAADEAVRLQNKAAEALFGPIPRNADLAGRIRAPGILDMAREAIASGLPGEIEHSERLPSESVYIVRVAPVRLGNRQAGSEPLFLISYRDISQARRIDRMRSDFVANASHELRTPLASLRGFIETLQGPAKNDVKAHERFLGIMHEQATRMSRLVDDLMSLSRLELKAHIAPDRKVDLRPLLGHVRDSLLPLAEELGVEVALTLPAGEVSVTGDRDELIEVFENLLENACKYGQEGKKVDIELIAGEGENGPQVQVRDYGPGIPPEHVPRVTERFYRVNVEASSSKKGTGLGLAIVKHILTRHRARLAIKSELGKGTTFTVKF